MKAGKAILIAILLLLIFLLGYISIRYFSWKSTFFANRANLTCTSHDEYDDVDIIDRVKNFVLSGGKTEFMTFTRKELLSVLRDSVKENDTVQIEDMCLTSERGMWKVYIHPKVGVLQFPWVGVDIVKDERETAELYSKNVYIGDMGVPNGMVKKLLGEMNKGISDGLLLVIENNFLGKSIQNIELLDDSIVIKGVE